MPTESPKTASPVPPEVVEMALQAVKDFHECFWFRHPEAEISDIEDVSIVIDHLRRYGGHRAWERAKDLRHAVDSLSN
ncbi:MAG: hypothetical protein KDM63_16250 [Verrucomicrobiae bacterium]|nr:hypothetical protein [Verrucomicrobiae bacterium]MCB1088590.1 hypothetical protein [Verrucomicrobiae bacterium]